MKFLFICLLMIVAIDGYSQSTAVTEAECSRPMRIYSQGQVTSLEALLTYTTSDGVGEEITLIEDVEEGDIEAATRRIQKNCRIVSGKLMKGLTLSQILSGK